jgi:hypothetical protein
MTRMPCLTCKMSPKNTVHTNERQFGYHEWLETPEPVETGTYFVMLSLNNGQPTPMVSDDGDPELFKTWADAEDAANRNPLGQAYRFEIYEW